LDVTAKPLKSLLSLDSPRPKQAALGVSFIYTNPGAYQ